MAEKFRSKEDLFEVEANQVKRGNYVAIAHWCEGLELLEHHALAHDVTYPAVNVPSPEGTKRAQENDWVVKYPAGYFGVFSNQLFHSMYEPVT